MPLPGEGRNENHGESDSNFQERPNREESNLNSREMSTRDINGFSPGGGRGGFQMGGGANLNYTDDELDNYSTIWEGKKTKTSDNDHKRVVAALKNISKGTDLESCMDVNNLLKYMAVHIFSVNDDSLSSAMVHHYYLYEKDSPLNIIPWDYSGPRALTPGSRVQWRGTVAEKEAPMTHTAPIALFTVVTAGRYIL